MLKHWKKLVLPLILLFICIICIILLPPFNPIIIIGLIACLLLGIFLLVKFFLPIKYAYLSCLFLGIGLLLGILKILDPINLVLLVSLFVGSIILIK